MRFFVIHADMNITLQETYSLLEYSTSYILSTVYMYTDSLAYKTLRVHMYPDLLRF